VPPAVELLNYMNYCIIGLNASPDMNPAIHLNADPDSGSGMTVEVKNLTFVSILSATEEKRHDPDP
jgi:hypothetical protein